VTAKKEGGELTVDTTGANNPMLAGNVVALLSPLIFIPILTYTLGPQNYDWVSMKMIRRSDDHDLAAAAHIDLEMVPGERRDSVIKEEEEQAKLLKASKIARWMTVFMAIALLVLWPMPMYGSGYIFSKKFFTGWVVVGIIWMFFSAACVGVYPLWEGRKTSIRTFKSIYLDITGKQKPPKAPVVTEGDSGAVTPPEGLNEKVMAKE
jgi:hypothetical protein